MATKPYLFTILGSILLLFSNCTGEPKNQLYNESAGSGEAILSIHGSQVNDREYPFIQHIEDTSRLHYGYLPVPENHANPGGREIEIAWAVVKSKVPETEKYPLIFLTGGPGGETLPMISLLMDFPLTEDRDVILFDQRGIGHSSPLPDFGEELPGLLAADLTPEEEYQKLVEILQIYREKSDSLGIGLQYYNTFQNARDIVSLMEHLDYEKYNIMGVSFGTRLARVTMDLSPELIHSAILDSPNPFDNDFITPRIRSYEQALKLVLENCDQDRVCSSTYPDLTSEYLNGVQALKDEPVLVQTEDLDFYVNAQDAIYLLRYQLYRDDALAGAPALIRAIVERDKDHIKENLLAAMPIITDGNYSMFLSTERFEHYDPAITRETLDELYSSMQLYPAPLGFFTSLYLAAGSWHGHSAEIEEKTFNLSDTPTLIFVNKYDPVTPPANGYIMNETLTSGHLLILDEGGHGGGNMECKMNVIREFMDKPSVLSGTECLNLAEMSDRF